MPRFSHRLSSALTLLVALAAPAAAQDRTRALPADSPFRGGVPEVTPSQPSIAIGIADAINRALAHNLGVLQSQQGIDRAAGVRSTELADLLPDVYGSLNASRRKVNLEAFGFPLGDAFPHVVGPYNLYDARVYATQKVFDLSAINDVRAETHTVAAAQHAYRSARDLVVLVAANVYLETLAGAARVDSAQAQLATSQALLTQAQDLRQSGIVAGLDVVRAEVRQLTDRQRATSTRNDYEKLKLQLARIMGLPIGQEFTLVDKLPEVPVPEMTLDEALQRAYRDRPDYQAAQERVRAAEASLRAATSERLPSVKVSADYGAIGLTPAAALPTFNVTGQVDVPLFKGATAGRIAEADADLRSRRAEAEDLRAKVYYDVRSAFLDLEATAEELRAAERARDLAAQELTQARDRFAAGVTNNLEVVQGQQSVALASEQYISALYGYNVSKALLAQSLGSAESAIRKYLGGAN